MSIDALEALTFALIAGIVPAVFWLLFWLQEDRLHPEPKKYITLSFLLGMLAVPIVIPFETVLAKFLAHTSLLVFAWAAVEELVKVCAAYLGGIRQKAMDEPIDGLIYLITAALGFSALENVLFLIDPFMSDTLFTGILTGNIRFVGATLLHIVSSGIIGAGIALSFFRTPRMKMYMVASAIVAATIVHGTFNFFILEIAATGLLSAFVLVWIGVILILLVFEKVKKLKKTSIHSTPATETSNTPGNSV